MFSILKDQYDEFWNKKSRMHLHQALQDEEQEEEDSAFLRGKGLLRAQPRPRRHTGPCMFLFVVAILAAWTFLMYLVFQYQNDRNLCLHEPPKHLQIYSPLEEAIEWEHYKFNAGLFGQKTEYMGQPDKVKNDLWLDIVEHGMVTVPESVAKRITNLSSEWSGKPGFHLFGTEMYHQLHCLVGCQKLTLLCLSNAPHILDDKILIMSTQNTMRIALWAENPETMYGHEGEGAFEHLDHCIDYLRQTLLCHGDVHLIPLGYEGGHGHPIFDTVHICRKYEPIVEWADEHQAGDITPNGVGPPSGLHVHHSVGSH